MMSRVEGGIQVPNRWVFEFLGDSNRGIGFEVESVYND